MKRILLVILAVLCIPVLAYAAPPPDPLADPGGFVGWLHQVFSRKEYLLLAGGILVCINALLRWQRLRLVSWLPWLKTRAGGWVLNIGVAVFLAIGTALASGHKPSVPLLFAALANALTASGVWEALKDAGKEPAPAEKPPGA